MAEGISQYSDTVLQVSEECYGDDIYCLCVYSLEKDFLANFITDVLLIRFLPYLNDSA